MWKYIIYTCFRVAVCAPEQQEEWHSPQLINDAGIRVEAFTSLGACITAGYVAGAALESTGRTVINGVCSKIQQET